MKTRQRLTPAIAPAAVWKAGGKPSTWFPPGGLVEQSPDGKQNNKDEDEDEDEGMKTEDRRPKIEDQRPKTQDRRRKGEDGRRKTKDRRRKTKK